MCFHQKKLSLDIKKRAGFTLVELLVASAVGMVLAVVMVSYFIQNEKTYSRQNLINEMQENIGLGMDFMVREIRQAGYGTSPAVNSANCSSSQLEINKLNDDPDVNAVETITYYVSGTTLIRSVDGAPNPLAENITAVTFACSPDPSCSSPQKITVTLDARTAKVDPITGSYRTLSLKSDVAIRNK